MPAEIIASESELDPDFDRRKLLLQPKTIRTRAAYRSPISSQKLNLQMNSVANDIAALYSQFKDMADDIELKMSKISEVGPGEIGEPDRLRSLQDYAADLLLIRSQIENLK